jgi:hypothetical protein
MDMLAAGKIISLRANVCYAFTMVELVNKLSLLYYL